MKRICMLSVSALFLLAGTTLTAADEGAALYKSKCAGCHGAGGEGKPAMKAPALKGTSQDAGQITERLLKGGGAKAPHTKGMAGLKDDQAKAIAAYVKTL
jgi:mono/diheme cytochrome c family protein